MCQLEQKLILIQKQKSSFSRGNDCSELVEMEVQTIVQYHFPSFKETHILSAFLSVFLNIYVN